MQRLSILSRVVLATASAAAAAALGAAVQAQSSPLSITVTGQSMIRGDLRTTTKAVPTWAPLLKADVVFTNFEVSIAEGNEWQRASGFLSPPEALDTMREMGVNLLALANNHAFDGKIPGIQNTMKQAAARNLVHAGVGNNIQEATAPAYLKTPKGTVALVAIASGLIDEGGSATATRGGVNEMRIEKGVPNAADTQRILQAIREARGKADLVVVSQHNHVFMDDVPFATMMREELAERLRPPDWMVKWTHAEIEAGADVIAMTGAPLLHGVEIYRGRPIFYDLGNFIFQYPPPNPTMDSNIVWESVVATAEFRNKQLESVTIRPLTMNKIGQGEPDMKDSRNINLYRQTRGVPTPATGEQARFIFRRLSELSRPFGTTLEVNGDIAKISLKK